RKDGWLGSQFRRAARDLFLQYSDVRGVWRARILRKLAVLVILESQGLSLLHGEAVGATGLLEIGPKHVAPQLLVVLVIPDFLDRIVVNVSERRICIAMRRPIATWFHRAVGMDDHLLPRQVTPWRGRFFG